MNKMPGIIGWHSTGHAEGALPNGTRVRKIRSRPNDAHIDGEVGVLIGSEGPLKRSDPGLPDDAFPDGIEEAFIYFVLWDDMPAYAVAVASFRIEIEGE